MTQDPKAHSRERFSQYAQGYVTSDVHSQGADLDRLLEIAAPSADWLGIDIATGGGHTALKLAPHLRRMIATDYAPTMLEAARQFISTKSVTNIDFVPADAEKLPFADNSIDLVACRVAAHHFPSIFRFIQEAARVLKVGGRLIIHDHLLPEDKNAAEYIEAFDTLRDPSHNRALNETEWRADFLDAGLTVDHAEMLRRHAKMLPWAERQGCSAEVIQKLHIMMVQAPKTVADFINIQCAGTDDASFEHVYMLIAGTKK